MLDRYKILHELGRGPTGAVYAASDRATGAVVALKRLDPALLASDASLVQRFLAHARSARNLRHPNIARIHEAGEAAGTAYVAMEMLEGESLRKILDDGPLPIARAIRIAHGIASGLAHAHLEGALHGAIKPANIIVLRSGVAKITDFGTGTGRPGTLSPEQTRGDPVDHRSDIFSLGALFYEMLTRRRPFKGDSEEPPPPSELNPHVPRALDAVVLSMLASQPADRMPGVPVLLRELERLEEGLGLEARASPAPAEPAPSVPPAPPRERSRMAEREALERHIAIMERESAPQRPSRSRPAVFAALALVLTALGIGLSNIVDLRPVLDDWPARIERGVASIGASRVQDVPASATTPREPIAAPGAPQASTPPPPEPPPAKPIAAEPGPSPALAELPAPLPRIEERPAPLPLTRSPVAPAAEKRAPAGTAKLILAVSPRGELYIDGEHRGTTPPVTTFEIEPGMHRIEVRSGSRTPYLTYMTVEAGDVRRIRHDFNAKPIRPPR